jgi:ribokinase
LDGDVSDGRIMAGVGGGVSSAPITVVGSLNMDFVVQVQALPRPGETVLGSGFATLPGGKGANQACAAARLGGRVRMVGRVGDDALGRELRESLAAAGVDTTAVLTTDGMPSGVALISVQAGGQNQIVVAPGAGGLLSPGDVAHALGGAASGLLLLQLESPIGTVERAVALGRERGLTILLDPAPARQLPLPLLAGISCLTPNESEALTLLGGRGETVSLTDAPEVARTLRARGPRAVILKLGASGAYLDDGTGGRHFPGLKVVAADTTAAGDTFGGALAVAIAEGLPLPDAIVFANAAAALSVTRHGAQPSMPTRAEVDALLRR